MHECRELAKIGADSESNMMSITILYLCQHQLRMSTNSCRSIEFVFFFFYLSVIFLFSFSLIYDLFQSLAAKIVLLLVSLRLNASDFVGFFFSCFDNLRGKKRFLLFTHWYCFHLTSAFKAIQTIFII